MTSEEITKLIQQVFSTKEGEILLDHLNKTLVDRPVYKPGMTLDQTAFREGQRDIIMQINKEVKNV